MKRGCKSWINCDLSVGKRVCADLRVQGRFDQVQEVLLLCGLLQGPHVSADLVWSEFLKILWALDAGVASEEQTVDGDLRQEGLCLVLFLRVENLAEVKTR